MTAVSGTSNGPETSSQAQALSAQEDQWDQELNSVELPAEVQTVVKDMIGNMAIEAIKMHNPTKTISLDE